MQCDPTKVGLRVWFVPEQGIEQEPSLLGDVVGVQAAVDVAMAYLRQDMADQGTDQSYLPMHEEAERRLLTYLADPQWSVSVPVCYGTVLIA
jgi:hypothetical protein